MKKMLFVSCLFFSMYSIASAHPGNTDSSGCHTCRTNCSSWGLYAGEYHCHNAKALPQPSEPIKSTYGANGTGYTTPAPEYKVPSTETKNDVVEKQPEKEIQNTLPISSAQLKEKDEEDNNDSDFFNGALSMIALGGGAYWWNKRKN